MRLCSRCLRCPDAARSRSRPSPLRSPTKAATASRPSASRLRPAPNGTPSLSMERLWTAKPWTGTSAPIRNPKSPTPGTFLSMARITPFCTTPRSTRSISRSKTATISSSTRLKRPSASSSAPLTNTKLSTQTMKRLQTRTSPPVWTRKRLPRSAISPAIPAAGGLTESRFTLSSTKTSSGSPSTSTASRSARATL